MRALVASLGALALIGGACAAPSPSVVTAPSSPPASASPADASTHATTDASPVAAVDPCADAGSQTLVVPTVRFDLAQDCYPAKPTECKRSAPLALANCSPHAMRIVVRQLANREVEKTIEPEDVLLSHTAITFPLPVNRDGTIAYQLHATDVDEQTNTSPIAITVTMRDPAREKARAQYCTDISGASSTPPPPLPAGGAEIRVARTPCYGPCPVYSVTVRSDGYAIYDGGANVRVRGAIVSRVAKATVAELVRRFDAMPPMPPHVHCTTNPDSPKTILTITRGARVRQEQVSAACGPMGGDAIAHAVEDLAGADAFVTGSAQCAERELW